MSLTNFETQDKFESEVEILIENARIHHNNSVNAGNTRTEETAKSLSSVYEFILKSYNDQEIFQDYVIQREFVVDYKKRDERIDEFFEIDLENMSGEDHTALHRFCRLCADLSYYETLKDAKNKLNDSRRSQSAFILKFAFECDVSLTDFFDWYVNYSMVHNGELYKNWHAIRKAEYTSRTNNKKTPANSNHSTTQSPTVVVSPQPTVTQPTSTALPVQQSSPAMPAMPATHNASSVATSTRHKLEFNSHEYKFSLNKNGSMDEFEDKLREFLIKNTKNLEIF